MTGNAAAVTIGMPVLDNARTLDRAIASVRGQSFGDWRLVICDDGSADGSDRIAEAAAAEDDRITLVRQPVRLGVLNFRTALDGARTPFFAWLAGDDYWDPDFLRLTRQALEAAGPAVSALPQAAWIGPPQRPIPNLGFLKGTASGRIRRYLAHPGGTRMYGLMRTDALLRAFPRVGFHAYDWYLVVRLLAQGPQLSLPQTLLYREETPWWRYAEDHAALHPRGLVGNFPVLPMSWQLLMDRGVPLAALPALAGLNLRKHEEILALTRPESFRRRRRLYRLLGLPIARDPARQEAIARRTLPRSLPASASSAARVTALLTFRNAARTLPLALGHLHALGCQVIAVDHGSTDESRAIAESFPETRLIDEPWTGTFDLQRQLQQKARLIAEARSDWILHADADEFLAPPSGLTLVDCLTRAEAAGHLAFDCDEQLFLPAFEDEEHAPEDFRETLTTWVWMRERDPKQRVFRQTADLGLWLRTGGHTVTRDPARIATDRLILRHYPGLSLDDLRGQYLARVFARDDRARLWHSNRAAAQGFDVVEPDPALLHENRTCTALPFLAARPAPAPRTLPVGADLLALTDLADLPDRLAALVPGLRLAAVSVTDLPALRQRRPVLNLVCHPAALHGRDVQRSRERARAIDWTRRIALARQWAVDQDAAYLEIRQEDLDDPDLWADRLARLWQPPVLRGAAGFLTPEATPVRRTPWEHPVKAITAALAADLGYR